MIGSLTTDLERDDATRHEVLSTRSAVAPLALVSAPQAVFEVTTLRDVVDANDGVLSLREAIAFANANPGHDEISFAPSLGSGAIRLTGGPLLIVDDLSLSGSGVTLIGEADAPVLDIRGATVALDQLGLAGSAGRSGISALDSAVTLDNVAVVGGQYYGIQTIGSTLTMVDSIIADNAGHGIRAVDSHLSIHGSVITNNGAYYAGGILAERGSFTMTTSTVSDNVEVGIGLVGVNDGTIADSVVAGNGGGIFTGIGSVTVSRTSITDNGLRG
jgi:fibronectin-binding autotransporter adhesin